MDFTDRLKNKTVEHNETLAWYHVSSLFTEIPIDFTFVYIIEQIYTKDKLSHPISKLLFIRLLDSDQKFSM